MAWRPSLEEPNVEPPKAPGGAAARPQGFVLTLDAFEPSARAAIGEAQRLATKRASAAAEPAHLDRVLAAGRDDADLEALDAKLDVLAPSTGAPPGIAPGLLARLDRAEAISALDGGRLARVEDLRADAQESSSTGEGDVPLDPAADELLGEARALAGRRRQTPSSLHLLERLARRPDVMRALLLAGVKVDDLRVELEAALRSGAGEPLERALARADGEATRSGRSAATPMDLALGVLTSTDEPLASVKQKLRLYATVVRAARALKLSPVQEEHLRGVLGAAPRWSIAAARQAPLTALMVLGAIGVTLAMSGGGTWVEALVLRAPIRAHELWRGVTSVFPHVGVLHLVFNIAWMWMLGVPLERRRGLAWSAAFYAWSAYVSSVAQVAWSGAGVGLSGLLYGVAGYHWMAQRREPGSPIVLSRTNANLLGGWLLVCVVLTELDILPIANTAHGMGLLTGLLAGWLATSKQRWIPSAVIFALTAGVTAWALLGSVPIG